jgi:hypothetical protein
MTLVDPFVPTRPSKPLAAPRTRQVLSRQIPAVHPPTQPQPDVRPTRPIETAQVPGRQQIQPATPIKNMPIKKSFAAPAQKVSRFKSAAQLTAIVVWALALGLGTYLQAVGEVAIVSYAVVALALKFSSRTTFVLALTAFLGVAVLQLAQPDSEMLSNFIVYAFLLLIFGAITAGLEIRAAKRWSLKTPKRRTKLQR